MFCNQEVDSRDPKLKALSGLKRWLKIAVTEQMCNGKAYYNNAIQSSKVPCRVLPADMAAVKLFPPSSSLIYKDSIVCQYEKNDPNRDLVEQDIKSWDPKIKKFLVDLAAGLGLETSRKRMTKTNRFSIEENISSITLEVNSLDAEIKKFEKTGWCLFDDG